ncbi:MAG: hypothetical protein KA841_03710 [Chitinophagales bacterium]|jgi:hypothetical protein|nr:hypothetical protein [Chitinophagales bacterium]
MQILSGIDFSVPFFKTASFVKNFILRGEALTVDAHAISTILSTPFFLRN